MPGYRLIFSRHWPYWLARHLAFWVVFSLWYLQLCIGIPSGLLEYLDFLPLLYTRLPLCMLSTYITLYVLIPRYLLARRYRAFMISLALLGIVYPLLVIFNPIEIYVNPDVGKQFAPLIDGVFNRDDALILKIALWDGVGLMLTVSGFAAVLRLMTLYFIENSQNKRLQQQKVDQDVQLIKSQLNSRFLFNTLQTIEANVRKQSPNSAALVLKLSDLLSYVLYENEDASVALNKEIEIIDGYLRLEKEGHGENISINITRKGDFEGILVVPLLLLPLVESCFEESINTAHQRSHIELDFSLDGLLLLVTLKVNNLRALGEDVVQHNIRIRTVIQRLRSFYSGRHQIEISTADNHYVVQLALTL